MLASSILAALAMANSPGKPGKPATTNIVSLPPPPASAHLGVQRARTVQGPYTVPGMTSNDTSDDNGMGNFVELATLPCHDCYITGLSFDIAYYPDDAYANVNTGMYLHHALLYIANHTDLNCPTAPGNGQRMFASGNERTYADLTVNGTRKAGYYVGPNDNITVVTELMNSKPVAREVVVYVTWDYVEATSATRNKTSGFASAIPVWLDIDGGCGAFTNGAEVAVPQGSKVFALTAPEPWSPPAGANKTRKDYDILFAASHLHDGGLKVDAIKNGALVCEAVAKYGETPGYISTVGDGGGMAGMPGTGMAKSSSELTHISSIGQCFGGTTSSDDKWSVTAYYNLTEHPGMMTADGRAKPVMGIAFLFLVEK